LLGQCTLSLIPWHKTGTKKPHQSEAFQLTFSLIKSVNYFLAARLAASAALTSAMTSSRYF